ncbi:putative PEP-binding protein [Cellulomonas oligotrophica]|uniref:Phosphoenolpyruvate-protein phosphotransferase n=1 Tax=Cellulomonas oligotrophica TaxID=931536 RepID=A0A7Y9FEB7_9CELL|nr:putative PEP-binding protein [Cellulomonas oligotrophica]NYD85781.1 phosphotransferase system enzyme I (PtsI) [Cellulomonas oligotrophica]GIG31213.1 phosphoenolpyruvate-protein phosphotransferase [Cellulomonas oligotrophica]
MSTDVAPAPRTVATPAPPADAVAPGTVITGVGAGRGAVVAPLAVLRAAPAAPADEPAPADPAAARTAIDDAFAEVASTLVARAAAATGAAAGVLGAAASIARDPALRADAHARVDAGQGPATAVEGAVGRFVEMFAAAGPLMAERVTDLRSVRDRVVARLLGEPEPGVTLDRPSVVAALDLSPADTAALDLDLVVGIVTELGGPTGHTAIVAGQLGLPCLVRATGVTALADGTVVALDAGAGTLVVEPDAATRDAVGRRAARERALAQDTAPGATADGHRIALLANIGTVEDAHRAAASAVEGVGLFRTEVLFLGRTDAPGLEEQERAYRDALAALGGRKTVVRTLDAGADKPLAFATQPDEENPALGVRGYRLVRTSPALVDGQLLALGRAAATADGPDPALWVMAPMVSTPAEARDVATRARAAGVGTVGVMVEVPAAALLAREILAEVDFVSLGTNDLAQYTMATDRLRGELADLLDPWQPAVLRLVAETARAGLDLGKPVGVCGESASDPLMALVLAGLGVTSLSMSPGAVPAVRFALRRHTRERCAALAASALGAPDAAAARAVVLAGADPEVADLVG